MEPTIVHVKMYASANLSIPHARSSFPRRTMEIYEVEIGAQLCDTGARRQVLAQPYESGEHFGGGARLLCARRRISKGCADGCRGREMKLYAGQEEAEQLNAAG